MNNINLMHGDCLELLPTIPDQSVDLVLTDPPYAVTDCAWDTIIPFEPMWEQLERVIKPKGVIVMTATQPFTTKLIASNMDMFKYSWVWQKSSATGFLNVKRMPLRKHEDILVFYNNPPTYNPQMTKGKPYKAKQGTAGDIYKTTCLTTTNNTTGDRYPLSIIDINNNKQGGFHPTQKPVKLMEYLINTYTNKGDTVLDFTMGSGSTGVAAANIDRSFIGIELNDDYFKIATDRIKNAKTITENIHELLEF